MKKTINREHLEGRVYDHNLSLKVTGENSKHPGTEYIRGSLDVATDDDILNIVTVNFTYVTATTSKGNNNETFSVLKRIIDNGKTVITDGAENATLVKIDTALGLNDFYTNGNGKEELVSAKRNDGGFVTIVSRIDSVEAKRNKFECDMLINGTRLVEADEERNIPSDYLVVKGAVFNFRNVILPVEFIVRSSGGIRYFESLEASSSNMVFTKVWGEIKSQTIVDKREEESAFGEAAVCEYERKVREWVITGAAKEPYEMGDEQTGITTEEIKQMLSDREVYLADVKRRAEEWQLQKVVAPSVSSNVGVTAAIDSFNF
jgi:hypothetical protein